MSKPRLTGMKVNPDDIEFESMIFYITWFEQLEELQKSMGDEIFIRGIKQLCRYAFHGEIPDNSDNPVLKMFFNMARASIDANIKLRIAGRKGNETMRNKATSSNNEKPKRGRKKKEDSEPEVKEKRPLTPKEIAEAKGYEDVDEDGFYPATPHNVAISKAEYEEYVQEQKENGTS